MRACILPPTAAPRPPDPGPDRQALDGRRAACFRPPRPPPPRSRSHRRRGQRPFCQLDAAAADPPQPRAGRVGRAPWPRRPCDSALLVHGGVAPKRPDGNQVVTVRRTITNPVGGMSPMSAAWLAAARPPLFAAPKRADDAAPGRPRSSASPSTSSTRASAPPGAAPSLMAGHPSFSYPVSLAPRDTPVTRYPRSTESATASGVPPARSTTARATLTALSQARGMSRPILQLTRRRSGRPLLPRSSWQSGRCTT